MIPAIAAGFVAGLAALLHCAGMCGPLCAAATQGLPRRRALGTYLGARLVSYALGGAIAGGLGGAIARHAAGEVGSALLTGALVLGLLIMAARVWPRADAASPALVQLGRGPRRTAPHWAPLAMGALTGLLPCGALASALLLAAGTGSSLEGVALMASFGVASSPALFAMGRAAAYLDTVGGPTGRKVVAAFLVIGAIITGARPLLSRGDHSCHDAAAHTLARANEK